MKDYLLAIADRAVRTAAQSAVLSIGVETVHVNALAVDWALLGGMALGGFVLSVLTSLTTGGLTGHGPSLTTERVVRTTRRTVSRNEGGWMLQLVNMDKTGWRIEPTEPGGNTFEMRRDDSGQVDAAYLLKVIVLALVAVLIVAVLFGAVPLDL